MYLSAAQLETPAQLRECQSAVRKATDKRDKRLVERSASEPAEFAQNESSPNRQTARGTLLHDFSPTIARETRAEGKAHPALPDEPRKALS